MSIHALRRPSIPGRIKAPAELATGIEEIDQQHGLLLAQLDYLKREEDQTLDSATMAECAYVIGQTLLDHFKAEEEIMQHSRMPEDEREQHIAEHIRIIDEYVALQDVILAKPQSRIRDVSELIEGWIVAHVADFDMAIRKYL